MGKVATVAARQCLCCGQPVAVGQGVLWAGYGFFVHQGECQSRVWAVHKDYSRSRRGRHRSRDEIAGLVQTTPPDVAAPSGGKE